MNDYKLITNTNNNKLVFPKLDFSIQSGEIKKVSKEQFDILILNYWIKEVINKKVEHINKLNKI